MDQHEQCTGPGIAEILESAHWKHALFTTYALSLSYLESELVGPLARAGCDDIWVIADAHGYRSSLLERRASRVGLEYRLIPAALKTGVFHPKIIYLSGDDGDLLLVGSGNLTFGGHGRNLEVFEVLRPDGHATAFDDLANILEIVATEPRLLLPRRDWAENFAELAKAAARTGTSAAGEMAVRLLHSLETPVVDQLADIVRSRGKCRRLIVQSPYHDPDGAGVLRLVEKTGALRCSIAVPAQGNESPFSFEKAAAWRQKVTPVRLAPPDARFAHAKWYELELEGGGLLFTGSFNATSKALSGTDNVEIGVLRPLSGTEVLAGWFAGAAPVFKPQKRRPSGLGNNELVYAAFDRVDPGCLRGRLISLQTVEGAWDFLLIDATGSSHATVIDASSDGTFEVHAAELAPFSHAVAVQLLLTRNGREARGWVHNEMVLGIGSRRRLTGGSINRFLRHQAGDDDFEALLDYLAIYGNRHLLLFNRPVVPVQEPAGPVDDRTISIALEELAPGERDPGSHPGAAGGPSGAADRFDQAMTQLRRALLGHGRIRGAPVPPVRRDKCPDDGDLDDDGQPPHDPDDSEHPAARGPLAWLSDFELRIGAMIDEADQPEVRDGFMVILLEVSLAMWLHHIADDEGARAFLGRWFRRACRLGRAHPAAKTALGQHVVTAAAILCGGDRDTASWQRMAAEAHDHLEIFYRGRVDREHALAAIIADGEVGFYLALAMDGHGDVPSQSLTKLLAIPTRRQQLEEIVLQLEAGGDIALDSPLFETPLGARLGGVLSKSTPSRRVRGGGEGSAACAFCYYSFQGDEAAGFARERIGFCIHCEKFTINTAP